MAELLLLIDISVVESLSCATTRPRPPLASSSSALLVRLKPSAVRSLLSYEYTKSHGEGIGDWRIPPFRRYAASLDRPGGEIYYPADTFRIRARGTLDVAGRFGSINLRMESAFLAHLDYRTDELNLPYPLHRTHSRKHVSVISSLLTLS